jgi:hypothetical protein
MTNQNYSKSVPHASYLSLSAPAKAVKNNVVLVVVLGARGAAAARPHRREGRLQAWCNRAAGLYSAGRNCNCGCRRCRGMDKGSRGFVLDAGGAAAAGPHRGEGRLQAWCNRAAGLYSAGRNCNCGCRGCAEMDVGSRARALLAGLCNCSFVSKYFHNLLVSYLKIQM